MEMCWSGALISRKKFILLFFYILPEEKDMAEVQKQMLLTDQSLKNEVLCSGSCQMYWDMALRSLVGLFLTAIPVRWMKK